MAIGGQLGEREGAQLLEEEGGGGGTTGGSRGAAGGSCRVRASCRHDCVRQIVMIMT